MVLWCRRCKAFMGVRDPLTNWTVDKNAVCSICIEKQFDDGPVEFLGDSDEHATLADDPPDFSNKPKQ